MTPADLRFLSAKPAVCPVESLRLLHLVILGPCDSLSLLLAIFEPSGHSYILWEGTGKGKEMIAENDEIASIPGLAVEPHTFWPQP